MLIKSGATILACIAMLAVAKSAEAAPVTFKVTSCLQRNHDFTQAFLKTYVDPINARQADIHLQYLGGPEVTPFQEQGPALKRGLIDMILCPPPYYGGMFGEARIPSSQTKSIDEIRKNGAWAMMEKAWNKHLNAHILSWLFSDVQVFYTYFTEKPKVSTKTGLDLSGMKIRSTAAYNPFLLAMGATTVVMAAGDVYAGLQRGVIQGLAWPWGSVAKYGWQRFLKYRVKPSFFNASYMVVVNLDKWKALSNEQQEILTKQVQVLEHDGADIMVEKGKEDDAKLRQAGVQDLELRGEAREAYLNTIYEAKWAQNDKVNHDPMYPKLRALLYKPK